jgi:hypothetical protein
MFPFFRLNGFLAAALVASGVLLSCGSKGVERTTPPPSWAPGISQNLARSAATTSCVIDNIGPVANPAVQKTVQVSGATPIVISGWAIDEANKTTAGGVDVVIDMAPYAAHYGSARPDVAAHFTQPGFRNSGFDFTVGPGQLNAGPHSVAIRVMSSDKKVFYQGPVVQFAVN